MRLFREVSRLYHYKNRSDSDWRKLPLSLIKMAKQLFTYAVANYNN